MYVKASRLFDGEVGGEGVTQRQNHNQNAQSESNPSFRLGERDEEHKGKAQQQGIDDKKNGSTYLSDDRHRVAFGYRLPSGVGVDFGV